MDARLILIVAPSALADQVCAAFDTLEPSNWWREPLAQQGPEREKILVLAKPGQAQDLMDHVSGLLDGDENWRQVLLPVEAVMPELLSEEEEEELRMSSTVAAREEILSRVRSDGVLTPDFVMMVALSTIVAAIGLNSDQLASVIGAMVIAPLLGPVMAFSLAVALGARSMILHSLLSNLVGMTTCILASGAMALVLEVNTESGLLDYNQPIDLGTLALALASGAAAALATATSKSTTLVGVMVAAALLPPVAASGLLLAAGSYTEAARAAFIVLANLVCITLSAQLVFWIKGIRPRRWSEVKAAETSRWVNLAILGALLAGLAVVILVSDVI